MDAKIKRVEEVREVLRINKTSMAKILGIDHSTYYNLIRGKNGLRLAHVDRLMRHSKVNPYWILTGEQDMFLSPPDWDWSQAPPDDTISALCEYVLKQWPPPEELSDRQRSSLLVACANTIHQNPEVRSFEALAVGVRVYLLYIRKYPRLAVPNAPMADEN